MDDAENPAEENELTSRAPTEDDLVALCRRLNELGAEYLIIGGFAIIYAGYARTTMDVDLLIATGRENESKVFQALEILADQAVRELEPGELKRYAVIRVADEITVDLMASASGIDFSAAKTEIIRRRIHDVEIPFASAKLLWRMKRNTHREKDQIDLLFLREHYPEAMI